MDESEASNNGEGNEWKFWSKFGRIAFGFLLCGILLAVGGFRIYMAGWTSKLAELCGYYMAGWTSKLAELGGYVKKASRFPGVSKFMYDFFSSALQIVLLIMGLKYLQKKFLGSSKDEVEKSMLSTTKFNDVKGIDEAKAELQEIVQYLHNPKKYNRLGGKLPKGILLVGPPGTGKTMLARAIAGEAGVPIFCRSGSEFDEMYVGVGALRVRALFAAAKKKRPSPCIIFIDEIDAMGGSRDKRTDNQNNMTLNQFLTELDGFKQTDQAIIVIGATNYPESLDKALVRPGRFDRQIVVSNPDVKGRREIMESHMSKIPKASDIGLEIIAKGTPGFSGADLANLVNTAAVKAASTENAAAVTMADLEFAKDKIVMGSERASAVISEKTRKITAYHEGGHAIVAIYTKGARTIHKATIAPRGNTLGFVAQLPSDERILSRRELLAMLDVCMGGRVAEELIFGEDEVTTGAYSDFLQATSLARDMVTKYGMSSKIGFVAYKDDGGEKNMSKETRLVIEDEVKNLLDKAYANAKITLEEHKAELHRLASELLERHTLTADQIKRVLADCNSQLARVLAVHGSKELV